MKSIEPEFELDPKHPGLLDGAYVARRRRFYDLGREYRLGSKGIPAIAYSREEDEVWRLTCAKLEPIHRVRACGLYLDGKRALRLDTQRMPQLGELDRRLSATTGFSVVPAEGLVPSREFFAYLARGQMPCTQYIRHHSRPDYTPEPDSVHDVLGHLPFLTDAAYGALIRLIGLGAVAADDAQLAAFSRWYWFGIEFGLILEAAGPKVLGAGLLSSAGEMESCFSDEVERRPFTLEEVIATPYDGTVMQKTLFVVQSLDHLRSETVRLLASFYGGEEADRLAGASERLLHLRPACNVLPR